MFQSRGGVQQRLRVWELGEPRLEDCSRRVRLLVSRFLRALQWRQTLRKGLSLVLSAVVTLLIDPLSQNYILQFCVILLCPDDAPMGIIDGDGDGSGRRSRGLQIYI